MKNILVIVLTSLALSNMAFAHVCTYVKQIKRLSMVSRLIIWYLKAVVT
jgi:hypothetical protein